jgi:hypothetical protein
MTRKNDGSRQKIFGGCDKIAEKQATKAFQKTFYNDFEDI